MVGIQQQSKSRRRDRGAGLVEYALLLALIAFVCIGALAVLRRDQRRQHQQLRQLGGHRRQLISTARIGQVRVRPAGSSCGSFRADAAGRLKISWAKPLKSLLSVTDRTASDRGGSDGGQSTSTWELNG